jgi:hypothetical protein
MLLEGSRHPAIRPSYEVRVHDHHDAGRCDILQSRLNLELEDERDSTTLTTPRAEASRNRKATNAAANSERPLAATIYTIRIVRYTEFQI